MQIIPYGTIFVAKIDNGLFTQLYTHNNTDLELKTIYKFKIEAFSNGDTNIYMDGNQLFGGTISLTDYLEGTIGFRDYLAPTYYYNLTLTEVLTDPPTNIPSSLPTQHPTPFPTLQPTLQPTKSPIDTVRNDTCNWGMYAGIPFAEGYCNVNADKADYLRIECEINQTSGEPIAYAREYNNSNCELEGLVSEEIVGVNEFYCCIDCDDICSAFYLEAHFYSSSDGSCDQNNEIVDFEWNWWLTQESGCVDWNARYIVYILYIYIV